MHFKVRNIYLKFAIYIQSLEHKYEVKNIVVGAILIGFLHIFASTGYPISHKIILKCSFMQTALALQNHGKIFSQLVPNLLKLTVLAAFLLYQNSPTIWGYLDTPILFKRKPVHQLAP